MTQKYSLKNRMEGGPGNSQYDATENTPPEKSTREPGGQNKTKDHLRNPRRSAISGGGGERDSHHTHNPDTK